MIVSCTKCSTKYNLNLSSVGENGQKVRCTKCGYVWVYHKKSDNNHKEGGIKVDISRNLPVVIEYIVPGWFKVMPVIFLALIIMTLAFFFQENLSDRSKTWRGLYNAVGLPYNRSLVIEKFDITKNQDRYLEINASLINTSQENRKLPSLVIRALDFQNKNVAKFYVDPQEKVIGAGGEYHFFHKIENFPENTKVVIAELEDKFDWINR